MKRIGMVCFVFLLLTGLFSACFALSAEEQSTGSHADSVATINQYIEAVNNQDMNALIALSPKAEEQEWRTYFSDNARNDVGFRAIRKAEISFIEPVAYQLLIQNTNVDGYDEKYGDTIEGYLVGTILEVAKDDEYFHGGLNIHLAITAIE